MNKRNIGFPAALAAIVFFTVGCPAGHFDTTSNLYDQDGDGFTSVADCADGDPYVHPGMMENCTDLIDNDCNQQIDGLDPDCQTGQNQTPPPGSDADGDGFRTVAWNNRAADCLDTNAAVYPGAAELCSDGLDNDCDLYVDASDPACQSGAGDNAVDNDFDGYTELQGDCNDANAAVSPADVEVANGLDDDCDGSIDEGVGTTPTGSHIWISGSQVCVSALEFTQGSTWQSNQAFVVGYGSWDFILADSDRITPSAGRFCLETGGIATGTHQITLVSTRGANGSDVIPQVPSTSNWVSDPDVVWLRHNWCLDGVTPATDPSDGFCRSQGSGNFLLAFTKASNGTLSAGPIN